MPETVGVRELRQNLSVYLRRVKAGERLVVTERNLPVAELVPLAGEDRISRLVAEGKIRLATGTGHVSDIEPLEAPYPHAGTLALQEQRAERP